MDPLRRSSRACGSPGDSRSRYSSLRYGADNWLGTTASVSFQERTEAVATTPARE